MKEMFLKGDISFNDQVYISNVRQKNALLEALESMKKVIRSTLIKKISLIIINY